MNAGRGRVVVVWIALLLVAPALAQDAAPPPPDDPAGFWAAAAAFALEHAFALAMLLVFITAIVSSYLSRRLSDRCLRHLQGFPVTVEFKNGQRERGILDAENNGLQLDYATPMPAEGGMRLGSFVCYQTEYPQMQAIVCYEDALDSRQLRTRLRRLQRSLSPGIVRRVGRKIRNIYAAVKDAFGEAFALLLGRLKTAGPQAALLKSQDRYVSKMGTQMIGAATASNYDPLLEKLIGHRVAVEIAWGDDSKTLQGGLLKEYIKDFFELHDTEFTDGWVETVGSGDAEREFLGVKLRREGDALAFGNDGSAPVEISWSLPAEPADADDEATEPARHARVLDPGAVESIALPDAEAVVALRLAARKKADILLPRHSAVVRGRLPETGS
jgi:hypothetical protein